MPPSRPVRRGGLPLIFGLTAAAGLFEGVLSRLLQYLRVLFPPEVTGLVVSMVGIELVGLGCPRFLGYAGGQIDKRAIFIAGLTLAAMIGPTVWGKGRLRLYPIMLGLATGYTASAALGVLPSNEARLAFAAPLLSLPARVDGGGFAFSFSLLLPFLIAGLCSTLKSTGDLTLCQKTNDANWKRTDMKSVSGGILAGAICTTLAGLGGGVGQSTFSSNVGLTMATGATSRVIALPTGLFVIGLAFCPRLAAAFSIMPVPVMGAVLVYVACFMIVGGLQVITSRMLDIRRTFAVGIALIFGLSVEMVPGLFRQVPSALAPVFSSALIALQQRHVATPVRLELCFDEFNLEADIQYEGEPIELPHAPPSMEVFGSSPGSAAGIIASYLVCQFADRVSIRSADGHCHVHLHFEH